jgi:hypothetical protein
MSDEQKPRVLQPSELEAPADVPVGEVEAILPAAPVFALPLEYIAAEDAWDPTDIPHDGNFSKGIVCEGPGSRLGLLKPGQVRPQGSHEAFREFVCSNLGRWLGVAVPPVMLMEHSKIGPASLCPFVEGTVFRYSDIMLLPGQGALKLVAEPLLPDHFGKILVLDVLVGAEDRSNFRNHIYVEETRAWHTLDYGLAFGMELATMGVGDPDQRFINPYLDDMRVAARLSRGSLRNTLKLAKSITEHDIKGLVALPSAVFVSDDARAGTISYLTRRLPMLDDLVQHWWKTMGLPGEAI